VKSGFGVVACEHESETQKRLAKAKSQQEGLKNSEKIAASDTQIRLGN
jgi:hypothetical protein